jgi:cell division protein FtsB
VGIIALLLAVAGVLGISFRNGKNTTTLANYREAAQAWEAKSNAQESQIKDLQDQVAALTLENTRLDAEMHTLRDLVTGRAELQALREHITGIIQEAVDDMVTRDMFEVWKRHHDEAAARDVKAILEAVGKTPRPPSRASGGRRSGGSNG